MQRSFFCFVLLMGAAMPHWAFAAQTDLTVDAPYVRLAPPSAQATAAFMTIRNAGRTERKLVKADSPVADTVELHTHFNENGVMKMRQVPSIEIKAGGQTELKPGSYHVMLIGMKKPLKEGDVVPIALSFDDGSTERIEAPVRRTPAAMPNDKGMEHGGMKH